MRLELPSFERRHHILQLPDPICSLIIQDRNSYSNTDPFQCKEASPYEITEILYSKENLEDIVC